MNFLRGKNILIQLSVPQLVEKVFSRKEGVLTSTGAVSATTGKYTGDLQKINILLKKILSKIKLIGVRQSTYF